MVKEGYRKTDIGVIPEDWSVKKIGSFALTTAGGTPSTSVAEYWGGNIKWMSSGELNNRRIYDVEGRITEAGLKNSSAHMLPTECVLIGLAGQGKTRGTTAINYVELCTNQSIAAIFPSEQHDSEYLYHHLTRRYMELRELSSGGGGRGGLNLKIINSLECALPSKEEQHSIATVLYDIDTLIADLEKLIEKKKNIKQSVMQELLTGKKRLPGFSGEIQFVELQSLCEVFCDGDWIESKDQGTDEIRLVQTGNIGVGKYLDKVDKARYISKKTFERLHCTQVYPGYVLVSRLPEPAGRACIVPPSDKPMITAVDCTIIKFVDYNPYLFISYSQIKNYQEQIDTALAGSTRQRISRKELGRIQIPVFPYKAEEAELALFFEDMDHEIQGFEDKLEKYRAIKQGMMQKLLTGEIRLV